MPLEPDFDNIDSLDPLFPFTDDQVSEGDNHVRGLKNALKANVTGNADETRLLVQGLVRLLVLDDTVTIRAGNDNPALRLRGAADELRVSLSSLGGGLNLQNQFEGGLLQLLTTGPGGNAIGAVFAPEGASTINHGDGTARLVTSAIGAAFQNTTFFDILTALSSQVLLRLRNDIAGLRLVLQANGDMYMAQADAGGGEDFQLWRWDRDGEWQLMRQGEVQLLSGSVGVTLRGVSGSSDQRLMFQNEAGEARGLIAATETQFIMRAEGEVIIQRVGQQTIFASDSSGRGIVYQASSPRMRAATVGDRDAANSGGEVTDQGGVFRSVGFNEFLLGDVASSRSTQGSDNGRRLRITGAGVTLTLHSTPALIGHTMAIVNRFAGEATIASAEDIRWYDPSGGTSVANSFTLVDGAALSALWNGSEWEIWGGGIE